MDFLVLSPPVIPPSEPPSGAFLLASGLAGRGLETGRLDLSLSFFQQLFKKRTPAQDAALRYLTERSGGYLPSAHRSAAGHLHAAVSKFGEDFPGWRLTLMDIAPPGRIHHPHALQQLLKNSPSPFQLTYDTVLAPALEKYRPKQVLISLAYLSQLPAAIDLQQFLAARGITPVVGGSLPNSLHATGRGLEALHAVFPNILIGDGRALFSKSESERLLTRLSWPTLPSKENYISARPIIPLVLSSGCFWNKCLFCPDRDLPYHALSAQTISDFLLSIPDDILRRRPVIHLLDSALPPRSLREFLPLAATHGLDFFGFARPTRHLLKDNLIEKAAESGCLMLQLGAEGGSESVLDRFHKGISPTESAEVITRAAAAGIRTYLYLLFGLPGETQADLDRTLQWARNIGSAVDFLNLSLFNLPRYCELADRAAEFGIDLRDYPTDTEENGIRLYRPFLADGVDPREQARKFLKIFRQDPAVRPAHLQTPRWFRAAHLALMHIGGRRMSQGGIAANEIYSNMDI